MDTTQQPEALAELRERLRSFEADHTPDGWPAVRMRDITALLDDLDNARSDNQVLRLGYAAARLEIESLKAQLHAAKQINAAQFGLLAASIPGSALRASHGQAPATQQAGEVRRADAVNLARNALTQYDCAITKKGVRVLAEAVLSMDSTLTTPQPTQAQAAEPVARLVIGKTKGGVSLTHMVVPAAYQLQEGVYALYTAPQPVAREPLPKFLALKFHARRDKKATVTLLFPGHEAADAWVRGIKGGQHVE